MQRRLSSAEKGKTIVLDHRPAPRVGRVRVSEPDNPAALRNHSLTITGRVTNPSTQKVWSLIPFFTDHWKCDIPPVGSDLGLGMFQFQFELESDLQTVLEKRPYHYARWMVILQRWEPTTSPDFPSMIPFWIKIQGIPIHLWSEEVAQQIGKDIGTFEAAEITQQTLRMRVHVNGRLPIIKSSIVEYSNGDEVAATLHYEKLERHCAKCCRLDHEVRDCLEAKHEKKALLATQEDSLKSKASVTNKDCLPPPNQLRSGGPNRLSPRRNNRYEPYRRKDSSHRSDLAPIRDQRRHVHHDRHSRERYDREETPREDSARISSRRYDDYHNYRRSPPRRERSHFSGDSHSASSPKPHSLRNDPSRTPLQATDVDLGTRYIVSQQRHPEERERMAPPAPRQNLEQDQLEEAATILVRANISRNTEKRTMTGVPTNSGSIGRTPASQRLGIASPSSGSQNRAPAIQRLGTSPLTTGSQERIPATNRLGPPQENSAFLPRVPIMDRLGPLLDEVTTENDPELSSQVQKRKPGRPPGKKKVQSSPLAMPGTSLRKRALQQAKAPSCRKKLPVEKNMTANNTSATSKAPKAAKGRKKALRDGIPHDAEGSNSDNVPLCNLIPASTRQRADFRVRSNLVP